MRHGLWMTSRPRSATLARCQDARTAAPPRSAGILRRGRDLRAAGSSRLGAGGTSAQRRLGHRPRVARSHARAPARGAGPRDGPMPPARAARLRAVVSRRGVGSAEDRAVAGCRARPRRERSARAGLAPGPPARGSSRCRGRDRRSSSPQRRAHDRRPRSHDLHRRGGRRLRTEARSLHADELQGRGGCRAHRVGTAPRAVLVVDLADPLSMSPGEPVAMQMFLLNLPRPELHQEIHDAEGLVGVVDFGWDGVVGEFDGQVKYPASTRRGRGSSARCSGGRSRARTG